LPGSISDRAAAPVHLDPVPPQNPVDPTIVDVSTLEVRLAYPDTSPAVRPARDRQIEPEAAMRARAREIALLGCARR